MTDTNYLLFGGAGFIGAHFCRFVLDNSIADKIYIADLETAFSAPLDILMAPYCESGRVIFLQCDVRQEIYSQIGEIHNIQLVANFAAVHREPGHQVAEYYETNINGAERVCEYSEKLDIKQIIFTSSIAPYGPTEEVKSEYSLTVPETAYGCSKLVAEKIHEIWAQKEKDRSLLIVRPGVVFGAGENGNVSRMIRAVVSGYFVFVGNKDTLKAGIYVKELCSILHWGLEQAIKKRVLLLNVTMSPGPSVLEYVEAVKNVSGVNKLTMSLPYHLVYFAATVIELVSRLIRFDNPINRVRIRKIQRSNNIAPKYLVDNGYTWKFCLTSAFKDWKRELPEDWR